MKKHHACNESAVQDIIQACKSGMLSWEEVAKKALAELAEIWKEDLNELFFDEEDDEFEDDESIDELIQSVYDDDEEDEEDYEDEMLEARLRKLEKLLHK